MTDISLLFFSKAVLLFGQYRQTEKGTVRTVLSGLFYQQCFVMNLVLALWSQHSPDRSVTIKDPFRTFMVHRQMKNEVYAKQRQIHQYVWRKYSDHVRFHCVFLSLANVMKQLLKYILQNVILLHAYIHSKRTNIYDLEQPLEEDTVSLVSNVYGQKCLSRSCFWANIMIKGGTYLTAQVRDACRPLSE